MPRIEPIDSFDVTNHQFSVLFVNPRPRFLAWLEGFAKAKQIAMPYLYLPEDNTVVLIPNVGYFSEVGEFDKFISDFKSRLMQAELQRFQATEAELGYPLTAESFDLFFECFARHSPLLFTDF